MKSRSQTFRIDTAKTGKIAADMFKRLVNRNDLEITDIIAVSLNFQTIFEQCMADMNITVDGLQRC